MITRVINGIHYSLQISERMKIRRGGKKDRNEGRVQYDIHRRQSLMLPFCIYMQGSTQVTELSSGGLKREPASVRW
jgi:hypothetical protein